MWNPGNITTSYPNNKKQQTMLSKALKEILKNRKDNVKRALKFLGAKP